MNDDFLVYQAKSFYNAYIALEQLPSKDDPLLYYVPKLVNGAFAIELTLKAILTKQGIAFANEHNLKVLFDKLPPNIKKDFWDYLKEKSPEYADEQKRETELIIMSDAFVKWRYFYEGTEAPAFDSKYLAAFANSAIYMMFHLGYNAFLSPSDVDKTYGEIDKMFEDNRNNAYLKNKKYIDSKGGKA